MIVGADHEVFVRSVQADTFDAPRHYYSTCRCGINGPMRATAAEAMDDRRAHQHAVIVKALEDQAGAFQ